jgi:hypothetical protein
MNIKNIFSITGALLIVCLITSCSTVTFMEPLSALKVEEYDERLRGVWIQQVDNQEDYAYEIHILGAVDDGRVPGVLMLHDLDNSESFLFYPFIYYTTVIGRHHYVNLNIFIMDEPSDKPSFKKYEHYFILKYEISEDRLKAWDLGFALKEAVRNGKIKGIEKDDQILITDKAETIVKFIEKPDHKNIFHEPMVFRKFKLVPPGSYAPINDLKGGQNDAGPGIYEPPF